jgi:hypothetical protein
MAIRAPADHEKRPRRNCSEPWGCGVGCGGRGACSRRIVGWSMATTLATWLLDALNMALAMRGPKGVIHHSDQGSQSTSIEFGHRPRGRRAPLDGLRRRRLRQCHVRELLRHAGMRASRQAPVQDAGRGADRGVRFHRGLLQPAPPSFVDRVSLPIDYERLHAANPDAHQSAAVLAAVKDKPSGRPPSGAVLDRRCARRPHGMEEWLRRGPNKRMAPKRRAKCRQTRYPDPKSSTLHETGASPNVAKLPGLLRREKAAGVYKGQSRPPVCLDADTFLAQHPKAHGFVLRRP